VTAHALLVLYLVAGCAFGGWVYVRARPRDARAVLSACAAVALWPLWAPFALASSPVQRGPFAARIALALDTSSSRAGFSRLELEKILHRVDGAERRLAELDERLRVTRALAPVDPRARPDVAREQARYESIVRLEAARDRERHALEQLAELCELLENQHVLARLDTSDHADELQGELWLRVQALSELHAAE
jgi:hypothetical protein